MNRQAQILEIFELHARQSLPPPTLQQITDELGLSARSAVRVHTERMVEAGLLNKSASGRLALVYTPVGQEPESKQYVSLLIQYQKRVDMLENENRILKDKLRRAEGERFARPAHEPIPPRVVAKMGQLQSEVEQLRRQNERLQGQNDDLQSRLEEMLKRESKALAWATWDTMNHTTGVQ